MKQEIYSTFLLFMDFVCMMCVCVARMSRVYENKFTEMNIRQSAKEKQKKYAEEPKSISNQNRENLKWNEVKNIKNIPTNKNNNSSSSRYNSYGLLIQKYYIWYVSFYRVRGTKNQKNNNIRECPFAEIGCFFVVVVVWWVKELYDNVFPSNFLFSFGRF